MWHDHVIVFFSNISWDFVWLRHHELATYFAKSGNRVLFIEPIGIRMPKWEDRHRIIARLRNRLQAGRRGIRQVRENLWIVDPLVIPFQEIGFVHRRNVQALTARIQHAITEVGGTTRVVWTYVPTPLACEVTRNLRPQFVAYDCSAALTENPKGVFASFAATQEKLSREADVVFVTSRTLYERQRNLNPQTYYVPHGVAYEKFALDAAPEPDELKRIPRPRLAFFGSIDERVDLKLIHQLAARHTDWQMVMLGIVRTDVSTLRKMPNVHFLGQISHDELPPYLSHTDVFLLPYVYSSFSYYMNPVKFYECLAVGKPTVAIALPIFSEYRDMLRVATSAEEFEQLVAEVLREGVNSEKIEQRRACARANTWSVRFAEMDAVIQNRMARSLPSNI